MISVYNVMSVLETTLSSSRQSTQSVSRDVLNFENRENYGSFSCLQIVFPSEFLTANIVQQTVQQYHVDKQSRLGSLSHTVPL